MDIHMLLLFPASTCTASLRDGDHAQDVGQQTVGQSTVGHMTLTTNERNEVVQEKDKGLRADYVKQMN